MYKVWGNYAVISFLIVIGISQGAVTDTSGYLEPKGQLVDPSTVD